MRNALHIGLAVLVGMVVGGVANARLLAESPGLGDLLENAIRNEVEQRFDDEFEDLGVPIINEDGRLTGWTHIGEEGLITYDRDGNVVSQIDDEGSLHNKPEVFREIIIPQADGSALIADANGARIEKDQKRIIELGAQGVCMPWPEESMLSKLRFCISPRLLELGDAQNGSPWLRSLDSHPGLGHVGGVERGGTFVLTRDDEYTIRADYALPTRITFDGSDLRYNESAPAANGDNFNIEDYDTAMFRRRWTRLDLSLGLKLEGAYEFKEEVEDVYMRSIPMVRNGCILNGKGGEFCASLSGLYETDALGDKTRDLPGLSGIPLLGSMFKECTPTLNLTELCIFITPRIIRPAE